MAVFYFTQTTPVLVYETKELAVEAQSYTEAENLLKKEIQNLQARKKTGTDNLGLPFPYRNRNLNTEDPVPAYGTTPYYTNERGDLLKI